jgi:hypothetical protein
MADWYKPKTSIRGMARRDAGTTSNTNSETAEPLSPWSLDNNDLGNRIIEQSSKSRTGYSPKQDYKSSCH